MTAADPLAEARAEAVTLATRLLASSEDLVVLVRSLSRLLLQLGVDVHDSGDLSALAAVDAEADAWPIGVAPALLDSVYRARCEQEMQSYGEECWQVVRRGCREVLSLLSRSN